MYPNFLYPRNSVIFSTTQTSERHESFTEMERLDRLINLSQDEKREVKKLVLMGKIATNSFEVFENDDELANTSKDALKTEGISGRIFDRMDSTQENIDAFFPNFYSHLLLIFDVFFLLVFAIGSQSQLQLQ